jgi:EmrB/QacA subfamily drug resistance transporter
MARISAEQKYQRRWWTLGVLSLSLVIIGLDNTILNVAIPTLQRELGASASELQWMVNSYVLVFAGLLLTMGAIGDRFGRARTLFAGLAVFGVASVYAAFTTSAAELIGARALMGVGGAMIMPATLSIITDVFPREERGKAIGIWAAVAGLGIGLGPIVGGLLLENYFWGAVFLVNIPVVIAALILGYFFVPASRDPEATPLDLKGAFTSFVAVTALVFGIIEGPSRGWSSTLVIASFAVAAVFSAVFIWIERREEYPMLNLDYFRNPRFSGGATAISIAFFSLFGVIFLLTQYLQFVLGYSALEAGVRTAPVAVGMVIGSAMSPRLVEKFGTTKVVAFGLFVLSATLTAFTFFGVATGYGVILVAIIAMTYGMGNIMAPSTDSVMGAVPVAKAGVGSATNDVTRQVAGAIGVAVIGSVFNSAYQTAMEPAVAQLPPDAAGAASNSIGAALQVASQLPAQAGEALALASRQGFVDAMGVAIWIPVALAALGGFLVLKFLPPQHLEPAPEPGTESSSAEVAS